MQDALCPPLLLRLQSVAPFLLLVVLCSAAGANGDDNDALAEESPYYNKRGWNNFAAGYGKRGWNNFAAGYGKRSFDEDEFEYPNEYFETYEDMDDGGDGMMMDKRAWNSGFAGMGKRAWNSGFAGMGKRAWNSGFAGMGRRKRAWNSGFAGMGKRAWNSGFAGMGRKRAWNSGFAGMGKRAWNSGFAGMGKRAWNSGLSSMGKRALEEATSLDVAKRDWASLGIRGSWGKRSSPSASSSGRRFGKRQHRFVMVTPAQLHELHENFLAKRTRGWLALRGLWGKRSDLAPLTHEDGADYGDDDGDEKEFDQVGKSADGGSDSKKEGEEKGEEPERAKRPIPKVSEEELRAMFGGGGGAQ